jgi:Mrp family chromosome partitioning ATPase
MSRVADALRRSGALAVTQGHSYSDERARVELSEEQEAVEAPWALDQQEADATELPWPIDDPQTPGAARIRLASSVEEPAVHSVALAPRARDEVFRFVKRVFLSAPPSDVPRSLLFVAASPAADGDLTCCAAAEMLAHQTTSTVCMVDANSVPRLRQRFSRSDAADEANHAGPAPASPARPAVQVARRLWLAPATIDADPGVAVTETYRRSLLTLGSSFDYVLIDASTLDVRSTADHLAGLVDGVVLLVDATATRKALARDAIEALQASRTRLLGAVLVNQTSAIPEALRRWL